MTGALVVAAGFPGQPAGASTQSQPAPSQFGGVDLAAWVPGSTWTYRQVFDYTSSSANVSVNEVVNYVVDGPATYSGYDVYKVGISGSVTGGGGSVSGQSFSISSGSVSGTEYLRRSDLALVYETETHNVNGCVHEGPACVSASASATYNLDPSPTWRREDWRLHAGDSYVEKTNIAVTGSISYNASGLSGSSPFNGTVDLNASTTVSDATISVPAGSFATKYVNAVDPCVYPGGTSNCSEAYDERWWAPTASNVAKEHLQIPLYGGATGDISRWLMSVSLPQPGAILSEGLSPNLSCAGGAVVVDGNLSQNGSGIGGQAVTATLDQSQLGAGDVTVEHTTTSSSGNYQVSFTAPSQADGMQKAGVIGSWGIVVDAGGTSSVATLEVVPGACSTLAYTGPTHASEGQTVILSAKLVAASTGSPIAGAPLSFDLEGLTASATTSSSGVASVSLAVDLPAGYDTLQVGFAGTSTYAPSDLSVPFDVGVPAKVTYTGPAAARWGVPTTLTASLTDAQSGAPIANEPVSFAIQGEAIGAITNANGIASASFTPGGTPGPYPLVVSFVGRDNYLPARISTTFTVNWQYVFTDISARGTVYLNPGNDLFEVALSSGYNSGVLVDPGMEVLALPVANQHEVVVTYTSAGFDFGGQFTEETGEFAASGALTPGGTALPRPIVLARP